MARPSLPLGQAIPSTWAETLDLSARRLVPIGTAGGTRCELTHLLRAAAAFHRLAPSCQRGGTPASTMPTCIARLPRTGVVSALGSDLAGLARMRLVSCVVGRDHRCRQPTSRFDLHSLGTSPRPDDLRLTRGSDIGFPLNP